MSSAPSLIAPRDRAVAPHMPARNPCAKRRPSPAAKRALARAKLKAILRRQRRKLVPKFSSNRLAGQVGWYHSLADDVTGGNRPNAVAFLTRNLERIGDASRRSGKTAHETRLLLAAELDEQIKCLDAAEQAGTVEAPHRAR